LLQDYADKAIEFALEHGAQYCDARAEVVTSNGFVLENGEIEHFSSASDCGLGIRVLANGAWGFYSVSDPSSLDEIKTSTQEAVRGALYYAGVKKQKIKLAETRAFVDKVDLPTVIKPTIEEMTEIAFDCDKRIRSRKRTVSYTHLRAHETSLHLV